MHQKDHDHITIFLEMKKYSYIQKSINVLSHIKELKDKKSHDHITLWRERSLLIKVLERIELGRTYTE